MHRRDAFFHAPDILDGFRWPDVDLGLSCPGLDLMTSASPRSLRYEMVTFECCEVGLRNLRSCSTGKDEALLVTGMPLLVLYGQTRASDSRTAGTG
jgi:hypothetical protein